MKRVKTLDRNYLATHPSGDEKADIELSAAVPEKMGLDLNPDGSRPQITIKVTGETYMSVLSVLDSLHDDPNPLLAGLMNELLTEEEMEGFDSLEQAGPLLKERFAEVTVPFKTFTVELEADGDDFTIAVTAPSAKVGAEAFHYLTSPRLLQNTAIAICPEIDDEGYYDDEDDYSGNEVLVIG